MSDFVRSMGGGKAPSQMKMANTQQAKERNKGCNCPETKAPAKEPLPPETPAIEPETPENAAP